MCTTNMISGRSHVNYSGDPQFRSVLQLIFVFSECSKIGIPLRESGESTPSTSQETKEGKIDRKRLSAQETAQQCRTMRADAVCNWE